MFEVSDREASERFYENVLSTLGIEQTHSGENFAEWNDFSLAQADARSPATRRLHVGFVAASRTHVDEFWRVGTAAGYEGDGEPGPRPQYSDDQAARWLEEKDRPPAPPPSKSKFKSKELHRRREQQKRVG